MVETIGFLLLTTSSFHGIAAPATRGNDMPPWPFMNGTGRGKTGKGHFTPNPAPQFFIDMRD